MTQQAIESTLTWQQKKAAEAEALIIKAQELGAAPELKAALLKSMLPSFVQFPGTVDATQTLFLSPEDKQMVILYAFIGLSELVSASGEMTLSEIWKNCINRSVLNLRKDGLIR
jgi:hypothetical protein